MRVSQLLHVIGRGERVIISDIGKPIDEMEIYTGDARGIKKDDPINRMHVAAVCACDCDIHVIVESPKKGEK